MTTRQGGVSAQPWSSLNVGDHVADDPACVKANRHFVAQSLQAQPVYVKQVHGTHGLAIDAFTPSSTQADVVWTTHPDIACAMMVADCLPVLVCHPQARWVAAAHAGWRGLAGAQGLGVMETLASAAKAQGLRLQDCLVWLGPCIGASAFEVGQDVVTAFQQATPDQDLGNWIKPSGTQFLADLAGLARLRLQLAGFLRIYGNDSTSSWCTYGQEALYHSHRRDAIAKGGAGRMAAYIWITASSGWVGAA